MSTPELKFSKPRPYKIEIPEEEVQRVKQYAELARLDVIQAKVLEQEPKDAMEYGLQPSKLIPLIEHLKSGYDWRKEEAEMNALGEHYMITLSGIPDQGELDMHVVVRKSGKKGAIPLLLAHGWPGSFFEFRKLAPLLTEGSPAFDLVMPSLPGFTFSAPPRRGPEGSRVPWTNTKLGLCADAAMRAFGYDRYVAQGGDVGSVVARRCAQLFPERCRSIHLNFLPVPEEANDSMSADEKRGNQRGKEFFQFGAAYAAMQGTTPYTLGAVLALSPLSTIAYLAEKWYRWSSPDKPPSLDEVLTNSLLYYYTGSTTSSLNRTHSNQTDGDGPMTAMATTQQPVGISMGHYEISWPSEAKARQLCPQLKSYHLLSKGSHFLAHEEPELLAEEMRAHFSEYGL